MSRGSRAPASVVAKFDVAKQAADLCTGNFDQHIVYEACVRGVLARRIPELRRYYQHKRTVMERALTRELEGLVTWPTRAAASSCGRRSRRKWTVRSARRAMNHGVIFVAGGAFFVDGFRPLFRAALVSQQTPERIEEGCGGWPPRSRKNTRALQQGRAAR